MATTRKLGIAALVVLLLVAAAVFTFIKSFVWSTPSPVDVAIPLISPSAATQPQDDGTLDFSKIPPLFTSLDFFYDTVHMDQPNGRIGSKAGIYFVESSPGTIWAWNRPWGNLRWDFACEVVGRVASGPKGAWALFLTSERTPTQGIGVTLHGDGTLEFGPNVFADAPVSETQIPPFNHPAIKPDNEFNRLLIILRGQELEIFVNGISTCEPIHFQQHVLPGVLSLSGSAGPDQPSRAEFKSCSVWRLRD